MKLNLPQVVAALPCRKYLDAQVNLQTLPTTFASVQFTAPFAGAACFGKQVSATKKQKNTMKLPSVFAFYLRLHFTSIVPGTSLERGPG